MGVPQFWIYAETALEELVSEEGHPSKRIVETGDWRWRFKAGNGRITADSGEGYSGRSRGAAKQACKAAIRRHVDQVSAAGHMDGDPMFPIEVWNATDGCWETA